MNTTRPHGHEKNRAANYSRTRIIQSLTLTANRGKSRPLLNYLQMSKQYNKVIKRRRRKAYIARRKEAAKKAAAQAR
jgi:hypothetical protein